MANYKQIWAIKKSGEKRIKTLCPDMKAQSGIYVWYRPYYKMYIGQSVNLLDRSISHLTAYDHLGSSIKAHGLYDKDKNPNGWKLTYFYCDKQDLDQLEQETIAKYNNGENQLYNITSGGQCVGKTDINERKEGKKYRNGVAYGYKKAIKEVAEYFEKYLDYDIKPTLVKKDGTRTAISLKKCEEFAQLLKGDKENE